MKMLPLVTQSHPAVPNLKKTKNKLRTDRQRNDTLKLTFIFTSQTKDIKRYLKNS